VLGAESATVRVSSESMCVRRRDSAREDAGVLRDQESEGRVKMGWIADRHMRSGGSIGPGGLKEHKLGAPLRKVTGTVIPAESLFSPAVVRLECGHDAESWGGVRARCVECKKLSPQTRGGRK
jgi:hypothetical protein